MMALPFLSVSFIMSIVAVLFIVCCLILILVILIQKGRGGGLSAAFGGGGAGSILGSKTGDFLTWLTIVLVGVFLMLAVVMAKFYKPEVSDFGGGPAQQNQPAGTGQGAPVEGEATTTSDTNSAGGASSSGG